MKNKSILEKLFAGSGWAVFTMFVWELVEEGLEQLIAVAISGAVTLFVTKALSTLAIITATQGIKISIKHSLVPFVKTFTYKKGNDKMNLIKKIFMWIYANKKSLIGTVSASTLVATGSGMIDINCLDSIVVGGVNVTPIIFYVALGILILIGVFGKGFESIKDFFNRIDLLKVEKEEQKIIKQANKELKQEEKDKEKSVAEKPSEREQNKQAKLEAKQRKQAELRAKIDEMKQKIKQNLVQVDESNN